MRFLHRHSRDSVPAADWADVEAPKVAQALAATALVEAHRQAEEVGQMSETLRRLRERNHFGEAIELAMQRRKPA